MSEFRPPGPYPLPSSGAIPTWVVRFDKNGVCVSPGTQAALLQALANQNADVVFFSHGWETDFGGATAQADRFLKCFNEVLGRYPLPDRKIWFVALTWPSKWFAANQGPKMAIANEEAGAAADTMAGLVSELAGTLDASAAARAQELARQPRLNDAEAHELVTLLMGSAQPTFENGSPRSVDDCLQAVRQSTSFSKPASTTDVGIVTGGGGAPNATTASGGFDPLDIIRVLSVYQMKDRAARVGGHGVASLITALAEKARSLHLVGHSFGAKVMLSGVVGDLARAQKPSSMLLLEPAINHLCFASALDNELGRGGYFDALAAVNGQILSTFSQRDQPLHDFFHLAVCRPSDYGEIRIAGPGSVPKFAALGGYGPADCNELIVDLPFEGGAFNIDATRKVVGLNGARSATANGKDWLIPSHTGVESVYTAWALRRQIEVS